MPLGAERELWAGGHFCLYILLVWAVGERRKGPRGDWEGGGNCLCTAYECARGLVLRVERGRVKGAVRASQDREGIGRGVGFACVPPVSVCEGWICE